MRGGPPPPKPKAPASQAEGPAPAVKMKTFFWEKMMTAKTKGTVFEGLQPEAVHLDFASLERSFQQAAPKPAATQTAARAPPPKQPAQPSFLDPKLAQNLKIFLAQLKKNCDFHTSGAAFVEEFSSRLRGLDSQVLHGNNPETLWNFATAMNDYEVTTWLKDNDQPQLDEAHLFFIHLIQPINVARISVLKFDSQLTSFETSSIHADVARFKTTCTALRNSNNFKKFLEIILAAGNFINHGQRHGGATGFVVSSCISKLRSHKDSENKTDLLQWLLSFIRESDEYKSVLGWIDEFSSVGDVKIHLPDIESELKTAQNQIETGLRFIQQVGTNGDNFDFLLQKFASRKKELERFMSEEFGEATRAWVDLLHAWGEAENTEAQEFFLNLRNFRNTCLIQPTKEAPPEQDDSPLNAAFIGFN